MSKVKLCPECGDVMEVTDSEYLGKGQYLQEHTCVDCGYVESDFEIYGYRTMQPERVR